jgi:hypothetical protein
MYCLTRGEEDMMTDVLFDTRKGGHENQIGLMMDRDRVEYS